jgi:RimJ/RimL family protein N-acetyltransferase
LRPPSARPQARHSGPSGVSAPRNRAPEALRAFLAVDTERPLRARAAKDNVGSLRVLAKCGFEVIGEDIGFANARGQEIEEVVLSLS